MVLCRWRWARLLLAVTAVATFGGCSSSQELTAGRVDAGAASTAPVADDATGAPAADPDVPTPAATAAGGERRARKSQGSPSPTRTEQVGGRALTVGKGVDDGRIKIGLAWLDTEQADAALRALAGSDTGGALGNSKEQAQAAVDHINASGGIGGLEVEPVYHEYNVPNLTTASGRARETQAQCSRWTEDTEVFAMVVVLAPDDNIVSCAEKSQTPVISAGPVGQVISEAEYSKIPDLLYHASGVTIDQREVLQVDRMVAAGILSTKTKLGLLVEGNSAMFKQAAERSLLPALARHRIPVVRQIVYPDFIESPWDSYVLQFRQAGVDTVYLGATQGGVWSSLFMTRAADNQKWYPNYIMGSDNLPYSVPTGAPDQAPNVYGAGWIPASDIGSTEPLSPAGNRCRKVMQEAGQKESGALGYCEALFFLQAALQGSTTITTGGLAAGTARLGTSFQAVMSKGTHFSAKLHYGANVVENIAYDAKCSCIVYVGQPGRLR